MLKIVKINPTTNETKSLAFKDFIFPAGEVSIKLNANDYAYKELDLPHTVIARIKSSDDLFKLAMLKDSLTKFDDRPINLFLPYVPYARQDRVCDAGESFSIAVLVNFIASLRFNKITIVDPHSNVTPAAFETLGVKLRVITQLEVLNKFTDFIQTLINSVLVSPDAGSNKKTSDAAGWLNHANFVRADKLRDLTNGKIKEIVVYHDDFKGKNALICDDICERGGTFIGLASVLKKKNCGKIILYVTHGTFANEDKFSVLDSLFAGGIDEIWTTDSYHTDLLNSIEFKYPNLHVLNLEKSFLI